MSALFRRRESAPLQLYGKLPLAKDYLRIGAGSGTGLAFREWLDRGFSGAASALPELPWPARFLVGGGAPLVGAAWPSSDAGGLRRFPFALFVERRRRPLLEDLERGLPESGALWQRLAGHYHAHENFTDPQPFVAALRGRTLEPAELEPTEPEPVGLEPWLGALWPDEGEDGLRATAAELTRLRRTERRGALRLPLAWALPQRDQVRAWWTLLVELGWLPPDAPPTLFFPARDADPSEEAGSAEHGGPTEASGAGAPGPGAAAGSSDAEPAFVAVFPAALRPADAAWLGSARAAERPAPLGAGDLCPGRARFAARRATPEGTPPLSDSVRGVLAGLRGA